MFGAENQADQNYLEKECERYKVVNRNVVLIVESSVTDLTVSSKKSGNTYS